MGRTKAICAMVAAVAVTGGTGAAAAGTPDGKFAVEEPGRATCAQYLKARADKTPQHALLVGFIQGYVTAANRYEPDTFDLAPWQNGQAYNLILTSHCEKMPADTLAMVAQKLVVTMRPQRLAAFSDLVIVGDAQTRRPVYKAVLSQAQTALTKKGLYRGPADGKYSAPFKTALQEFQKGAQLQPTGIPDTATLWVLLSP